MKKELIIILLGCFSQITIFATVITVDNNTPSMGDFTSLQAAHDAAIAGDTILVFPSSVHYQAITLSKKLIIIGAGSELIGNTKITYLTGNLVFGPGSDGSVVSSFGSAYGALVVEINANSIEVKRTHVKNIVIHENKSNAVITGCQIRWTESEGVTELILIQQAGNVLVSNNYIRGANNRAGIRAIDSDVHILNNILHFGGPYSWDDHSIIYQNSTVTATNNIFVVGKMTEGDPCPYNYNICCNTGTGISCGLWCGIGNISNIYSSLVFIDYDGGNYKLKPDSPAIGSGEGGTDIGIYGGAMPYVDGGYPDLPTIYHLEVPLTGNQQDGLDVIIKVKTNN